MSPEIPPDVVPSYLASPTLQPASPRRTSLTNHLYLSQPLRTPPKITLSMKKKIINLLHAKNNTHFPITQPNFYLDNLFPSDWMNSPLCSQWCTGKSGSPGKRTRKWWFLALTNFHDRWKLAHDGQSQTPNIMSLNKACKKWVPQALMSQENQLQHATFHPPTRHCWGFVYITVNTCDDVTWCGGYLVLNHPIRDLPHAWLCGPSVLMTLLLLWQTRLPGPCFQIAAWPHNFLPLGIAKVPGSKTHLLTLLSLLPKSHKRWETDPKNCT